MQITNTALLYSHFFPPRYEQIPIDRKVEEHSAEADKDSSGEYRRVEERDEHGVQQISVPDMTYGVRVCARAEQSRAERSA